MEEENKPKPAATTPAAKPTQKPKPAKKEEEPKSGGGGKGIIIILVIVVLALGGVTAWLFNQKSELESTIAAQESSIDEKIQENDNLTASLEDEIKRYEALISDYEALGEETEGLRAQMEGLEAQVKKWKGSANWNASQRKALQKEIEKMKAEAQLDLIALDEELQILKQFADSLKTSNDSLHTVQGQITEENSSLSDLVRVASVLKAENFNITAINKKNKEYEDDDNEFKAKVVDKIRVKFNFGDNKVAKKETKEVILRLIEPSGTVLFDLSTGGGSFTNADGKTDFYTDKQSILFDNSQQAITFLYNKGSEYEEGKYTVEIYANGYLIGDNSFTVK